MKVFRSRIDLCYFVVLLYCFILLKWYIFFIFVGIVCIYVKCVQCRNVNIIPFIFKIIVDLYIMCVGFSYFVFGQYC